MTGVRWKRLAIVHAGVVEAQKAIRHRRYLGRVTIFSLHRCHEPHINNQANMVLRSRFGRLERMELRFMA